MRFDFRKLAAGSLIAVLMMLSSLTSASVGPDEAIRSATDNLLSVVEEARGYYDNDPERYFGEVDRIIGPLVDFTSFSRGVMGRWGSSSYYSSLPDDEARAKFREQLARFSESFRAGLVRTYSKGLLAFSGQTIEVLPADAKEVAGGNVTVEQRIHGEADEPYVIRYKMKRGKDGSWQVRNVSLDSLNLGKVYQKQFASAAGKYNGDIDQVIDNWSVGGENSEAQ